MAKQILISLSALTLLSITRPVYAQSQTEIHNYCKVMGSYAHDIALMVHGDSTGFGKMPKDFAISEFTKQQDDKAVKAEIRKMVNEIYKTKPKKEEAEKSYRSKCLSRFGISSKD